MTNKNKLNSTAWSGIAKLACVALFGILIYKTGHDIGEFKGINEGQQLIQSRPDGINFAHFFSIVNDERLQAGSKSLAPSLAEYAVAETQCNKDSNQQQTVDQDSLQMAALYTAKTIVNHSHAANAEQIYASLTDNTQDQASIFDSHFNAMGIATCDDRQGNLETVLVLTRD